MVLYFFFSDDGLAARISGGSSRAPCTRSYLPVSEAGGAASLRSAGAVAAITLPVKVLHGDHAPGLVGADLQKAEAPAKTAPTVEVLLEVLVPLDIRPHLSLGLGLGAQRAPLPKPELRKVAHPLMQCVSVILQPPKPTRMTVRHGRAPVVRLRTGRKVRR